MSSRNIGIGLDSTNTLLLSELLFLLSEGPSDAWFQRYKSVQRTPELEETIREFLRYSSSVYYPDITKYNQFQLSLIVSLVKASKKAGLKSDAIRWFTKNIVDSPRTRYHSLSQETIGILFSVLSEDYIPPLKTWQRNKGILSPLENYADITALDYDIQDKIKTAGLGNDGESVAAKDIIMEKDGWTLAMPTTTESSCELGSGTTWCTARTGSQNLFLSYVARAQRNITLFYLIKQGGNPRKDPNDKISVGFLDGKPMFDGTYGGITVNAANNSVNFYALESILGKDLMRVFLNKMKEVVGNQKDGEHPAKEELKKIAGNVDLFVKKLESFKDKEARYDFFNMIIEYQITDERIFEYFNTFNDGELWRDTADFLSSYGRKTVLEKYKHIFDVMINYIVFVSTKTQLSYISSPVTVILGYYFSDENKTTDPEIVEKIIDTPHLNFALDLVAASENTPEYLLEKISKKLNSIDAYAVHIGDVIIELIGNYKSPHEVFVNVSKFSDLSPETVTQMINQCEFRFRNNREFMAELYLNMSLNINPRSSGNLHVIARQNATPLAGLEVIYTKSKNEENSNTPYVAMEICRNPNADENLLLRIFKDYEDGDGDDSLDSISDYGNFGPRNNNEFYMVKITVLSNPKAPEFLLRNYSTSKIMNYRLVIASNESTPSDIQTNLAKDPDVRVRQAFLNPERKHNLDDAILQILASDVKGAIRMGVLNNIRAQMTNGRNDETIMNIVDALTHDEERAVSVVATKIKTSLEFNKPILKEVKHSNGKLYNFLFN